MCVREREGGRVAESRWRRRARASFFERRQLRLSTDAQHNHTDTPVAGDLFDHDRDRYGARDGGRHEPVEASRAGGGGRIDGRGRLLHRRDRRRLDVRRADGR